MKMVLAIFGIIFLLVIGCLIALSFLGKIGADAYDNDDPYIDFPEHHNY